MGPITRAVEHITYEAAQGLIESAIAEARANGWAIAVVVLDPGGAVLAAARMDGVAPAILDIATDKAYTATLGKSTDAFYERMSSAPDLTLGLQNRPRLCAWEGGLPILVSGTLVGAIGVSGAAGPEDVQCARAALDALELSVN